MIDVVCGVIENADGRLLACQRPAGKHLGGFWEFPGGKVDPGESPETALARELREELAVTVKVGMPLSPVIWHYGERVIRLLPFRCSIIRGVPQAVEHEQLLWCSRENWHDLSWAAADVPILHEIFSSESE
jgi:8-oxo-dGTP diphosphatase